MATRPKHPGRRIEVLALIDGRHPVSEAFRDRTVPGWTSALVAELCGIAAPTAHHLLARLARNDLVDREAVVENVAVRRRSVLGSIPVRTLVWRASEKGRGRVEYFGGHKKWCPLCRTGR